jgi:hypothetical protein
MNDIGEDGKQMTMAEVIDLVLGKVLQSIGPALTNAGDLLKEGGQAAIDIATGSAVKKLDEAAGDAVNKVSEDIKSLFGK